jgi:hypothetical protein
MISNLLDLSPRYVDGLNIETILFDNEDLSLQINTNISEKVRTFIGRTNRFPTGQ